MLASIRKIQILDAKELEGQQPRILDEDNKRKTVTSRKREQRVNYWPPQIILVAKRETDTTVKQKTQTENEKKMTEICKNTELTKSLGQGLWGRNRQKYR